MKRISFKQPAYDHFAHSCNKPSERHCGHGIHNEQWHYVVSRGDIALALEVGSGIYLPCTDTSRFGADSTQPHGFMLVEHIGFPTDIETIRRASSGASCFHVDGGRCFGGDSTALGATEFFDAHFVTSAGFKQPDSFWSALEDRLVVHARAADAKRVDLIYERCHRCDGVGAVRR
jgi:hypothetical protein